MGDAADLAMEREFSDWGMSVDGESPYHKDPDENDGYILPPRPKLHARGCSGHQVKRTNSNTGVRFWGCSEFPKCRWSRSMTQQELVGEVPNDADYPPDC